MSFILVFNPFHWIGKERILRGQVIECVRFPWYVYRIVRPAWRDYLRARTMSCIQYVLKMSYGSAHCTVWGRGEGIIDDCSLAAP
jgi:hypothetical protein